MAPFNTVPISGLGGHSVKIRFGYTAGPSPTAANGIWLDDLKLTCYAPLSTPPGYEFLQGTSMAAPHVTGAAGLLFSLKPTATVTEARDALLNGVDTIPSLAGKTTSGGRLDIARAMEVLMGESSSDKDPPVAPQLQSTLPASPANDNNPRIDRPDLRRHHVRGIADRDGQQRDARIPGHRGQRSQQLHLPLLGDGH
jgi:subtilisin family serine protease